MRRAVCLLGMLGLVVLAARADNDHAFWGIFAETWVQKNAGMPAMPQMPALDPAMLAQLPAAQRAQIEAMMNMGKAQRRLTMRLWSPGIAPDGATASVKPPPGLKQGDKLDLALYRPKPETGTAATPPERGPIRFDPAKFTIKIYWGSSATVKPGQPEVFKIGDLPAEAKAEWERAARRAQRGDYYYKPDWTTGYWPTSEQPVQVAADATLAGNYALSTTYAGNVALDVPNEVNFLAPIEMSSPDLSKAPDLAKAMAFKWKAIPTCLGLHAQITAMLGQDTLIIWSSSEVKHNFAGAWDYLEMAQVREYVAQNVMMAGDRTDVTVPAGIFQGCGFVNMQMIGYGPGAANTGEPIPRIQTKTTLMTMLTSMAGLGRPGRGELQPEDGEE